MLDCILSDLGLKKWHHEFLLFGLVDSRGCRTMLFIHPPDNSIYVENTCPRLPFESELLGEVDILPDDGCYTQIEDMARALTNDDPEIRSSMRCLFEGIKTCAAGTKGARPLQVYLGRVTTTRPSLVAWPYDIHSIQLRGFMV